MNHMNKFKSDFTHSFDDESLETTTMTTTKTTRKKRKPTSSSSDSDSYSDSDNSSTSSDSSGNSRKVTGYTFPELDQYNSFINFLTRKRLASNSTGFSSHIAAFVYKLASKRQCLLPRKGKHRYRRKL
jgi:hypothetical protein